MRERLHRCPAGEPRQELRFLHICAGGLEIARLGLEPGEPASEKRQVTFVAARQCALADDEQSLPGIVESAGEQ